MLTLTIQGVPQPKQSVRFTRTGIAYQTKEVKEYQKWLRSEIIKQLPKNFKLLDGPLCAKVLYVFPLLDSFSTKQINAISSGVIIYKDTKPDVVDNLNKALFDAMEKVVMVNDSRVADFSVRKIYGLEPRTEIIIYNIEDAEAEYIKYSLSRNLEEEKTMKKLKKRNVKLLTDITNRIIKSTE